VAQKSKPFPNDQKIILNRLSMRLDLFVKLKYESLSTIILFVGIRFYAWPTFWPQYICL